MFFCALNMYAPFRAETQSCTMKQSSMGKYSIVDSPFNIPLSYTYSCKRRGTRRPSRALMRPWRFAAYYLCRNHAMKPQILDFPNVPGGGYKFFLKVQQVTPGGDPATLQGTAVFTSTGKHSRSRGKLNSCSKIYSLHLESVSTEYIVTT